MRALALFIAAALTLSSQQTQPAGPVIRVSTTLVQVEGLVTDSTGRHISDLTPADFTILEDGKVQRITHFSYIPGPDTKPTAPGSSPTPQTNSTPPTKQTEQTSDLTQRAIAVIIDDLHTSALNLARIKPDLNKFAETRLGPASAVCSPQTSTPSWTKRRR